MTERGQRLTVLGAGPVGLEAAARGILEGWRVTVLEAVAPARHLADWGHVRLFTPFGMNAGPSGLALLRGSDFSSAGPSLPRDDALLTGRELRDAYLLPLAERIAVEARLELGARVLSVGRGRLLKHEAVGAEIRGADPFRTLYERDGAEGELEADAVLDCTGTYGTPNWLGPGGTPARGERGLRGRILYGLPDIPGADRERFAGRRTLLVGGGHSAATAALALVELALAEPGTSFLWLTRRPPGTLPRIPDDPLPERDRLAARANALASSLPRRSLWLGGARVLALKAEGEGLRVAYEAEGEAREEAFDAVVANVGYEPDDALYRQLQVHECYASRGPMKLAAALLRAAGDGPADCLKLGGFGPEALANPEPRFFILGMKSYGRNSAFLLRTGYDQVQDAFALLGGRQPATAP